MRDILDTPSSMFVGGLADSKVSLELKNGELLSVRSYAPELIEESVKAIQENIVKSENEFILQSLDYASLKILYKQCEKEIVRREQNDPGRNK